MSSTMKQCVGVIILMSTFLIIYYLSHNSEHFTSSIKPSTHKMCDNLYLIAREMLNGSLIRLPFTTNVTRWKFFNEINPNLFDKKFLIWNSERKMSSDVQDIINLYNNTRSRDIKVRKYFITFADKCCEKARLKAVMTALYPGGFDKTTIHNMRSLTAGFKRNHSEILTQTRGGGYWLWKPYIILKTLVENMVDGEILMYQDAGAYITHDAGPLIKLCEHAKYGILLFYLTLLERQYTKRDAFLLLGMDKDNVYHTFQRLASFILFQKNCMSLQFVMEWLAYASDPRLITDMKNTLGKSNLPGFREHRHDQSILSLLSKKWGLMAYRTPSQYGNILGYKAGPYNQIIMHNRNRS